MESANPTNEQQPKERRFKVGDIVCWTNDNGVKWHARRIIGFDDPDKWGHRYYLEPTDAPWMYTREKNLALETLDGDALERTLSHDYSLRKFCERHPHYLGDVAAFIATRGQHHPAEALGKIPAWTSDDRKIAEGQGWDMFNIDEVTGRGEIQRDDEVAVFPSDEAAIKFVRQQANAGDVVSIKALKITGEAVSALEGSLPEVGYSSASRIRAAQKAIMVHAEMLGIEQDEATLVDELVKSLREFAIDGKFASVPVNLPEAAPGPVAVYVTVPGDDPKFALAPTYTAEMRTARMAQAMKAWHVADDSAEDIASGSGRDEHAVVCMLADLRHYCDTHGLDFPTMDRHAYADYREQLANDRHHESASSPSPDM